MGQFLAYIRVSTAKQGERGVSLQEQRDAIERYAQRNGLVISNWFEERETAARRGRPVFSNLLRLLRQRKAAGLIVHKIDRSARNLKDWADLGELIDQGVVIHFANESLDLQSRGGRLSADIQAVVAADYIRNLREETRKGFYGRIKQGLYPLPAPLGYLDRGKGKPKEIDPVTGPLVRSAFELYGTGKYNLLRLKSEVQLLGLRNKKGTIVSRNGLSLMLNNPFYVGIIRLRKTNETFPGSHEPLIDKSLFVRVQQVLKGKTKTKIIKHDFIFRRLLSCKYCGRSLTGERQKRRYIYYRCHTNGCRPINAIREERVQHVILERLASLRFSEQEQLYLKDRLVKLRQNWAEEREDQIRAYELKKTQLQSRLSRLTDAFLDQAIEKDIYEEKKRVLLFERAEVDESLIALKQTQRPMVERVAEIFKLANDAYSSYELASSEERQELLRLITSNCIVEGENVVMTLALPLQYIADRQETSCSSPSSNNLQTLDRLLEQVIAYTCAHSWPPLRQRT